MDSIPLEDPGLPLETKLDTTFSLNSNPNNNNDLSSHLSKRYTTFSIPSSYGRMHSSPPPGTVAGIVIGSVGGVVLILYLTFLALNPGGLARGSSSSLDEEVVVTSRRAGSRRSRSNNTIEVVEERDRRSSYRRRPSPRDDRDHIIVEESMTSATSEGRDVIEVVEEESSMVSSVSTRPPRRARSHRSGVRTVDARDPLDYGHDESDVSRY
ncbi:hypothetical protein N7528_007653 [Penicillium herquei]|nr:hypothetical protein N7528_007653 [Penicillium herquei]